VPGFFVFAVAVSASLSREARAILCFIAERVLGLPKSS